LLQVEVVAVATKEQRAVEVLVEFLPRQATALSLLLQGLSQLLLGQEEVVEVLATEVEEATLLQV
jgi:hypothetical protein